MSKTLADAMAYLLNCECPASKYLGITVVKEHFSGTDNESFVFWPGKHKNVHYWVELENGKSVGMNENPAIGITFPVISYSSNLGQPRSLAQLKRRR